MAAIIIQSLGIAGGFLIAFYLPLAFVLWLCGVSKATNNRVGQAIFVLGAVFGVFKFSTESPSLSETPESSTSITKVSSEQVVDDWGDMQEEDVWSGTREFASDEAEDSDSDSDDEDWGAVAWTDIPPTNEERYLLAKQQEDKKQYVKAIEHYSMLVDFDPRFKDARRRLAWLLATVPSDLHRDGKRARSLIVQEFRDSPDWSSDYKLAVTLSAVLAENGDFEGARKHITRAAKINPKREAGCRLLLNRFQNHQPWRL